VIEIRESKEHVLPECFCCGRKYKEEVNGAFYACFGNGDKDAHPPIFISKKYFVSGNGSETGNLQKNIELQRG